MAQGGITKATTRRNFALSVGLVLTIYSPLPLQAQVVSVQVPPSLILPNYDRVPIGQREGLEAGAFIARTDDAAANWFNPAGLAKSEETALNASATAYEWTSLGLEGLGEHAGQSRINTIGTLFAAVLGKGPLRSDQWRLGFSITTPILWHPSGLDLVHRASNAQEIFAYSTQQDLEVTVPALAVAFAPGGVKEGNFRVGLGAGVAMTSLSQDQSVSDRLTSSAGASVATRTFSADGEDWHLALSAGLQWQPIRRLTVAARLFAPTARIHGSTRLTSQGSTFDGTKFGDLIFLDSVARFEYRLPLQGELGVAAALGAGSLEFDVRYYASVDNYDMYSSSAAGRLTVQAGAGTPVVTPSPFVTTPNSARAVVNLAIGGNYPLTHGLRAHAGFSTDQSPVDDESRSIFRKVNLSRFTTGLSVGGGKLSGSLGLGYSFGSGTRLTLAPRQSGGSTETRLTVTTVNVLFAVSYSFSSR